MARPVRASPARIVPLTASTGCSNRAASIAARIVSSCAASRGEPLRAARQRNSAATTMLLQTAASAAIRLAIAPWGCRQLPMSFRLAPECV